MIAFGAPKPIVASAGDAVNCPITSAFDYVGYGYFQNCPSWCPQIVELESLSGAGIHAGSVGRQVTFDRGIRSESTFEVAQFLPLQKLEIKGITEPYRSCYEFSEEAEATTRLAFTFELKSIEIAMRPFQKLISVALQEGAEQTIENLKRLLEDEAVQRPGCIQKRVL